MEMRVVWFEGMERDKVQDARDWVHAFVSHYARIVFGRNFGMKGRSA